MSRNRSGFLSGAKRPRLSIVIDELEESTPEFLRRRKKPRRSRRPRTTNGGICDLAWACSRISLRIGKIVPHMV
jgi:hypothetical protein